MAAAFYYIPEGLRSLADLKAFVAALPAVGEDVERGRRFSYVSGY